MKPEFAKIIERVEEVRHQERLNKSRFSERIGLTPQTDNNFIGPQCSKPSVELVAGVCREFCTDANWLLLGKTSVDSLAKASRLAEEALDGCATANLKAMTALGICGRLKPAEKEAVTA